MNPFLPILLRRLDRAKARTDRAWCLWKQSRSDADLDLYVFSLRRLIRLSNLTKSSLP